MTAMFAGDLMMGRGVDQVLKYPGASELKESYVKDARDYVQLALEAVEAQGKRWIHLDWKRIASTLKRQDLQLFVANLETTLTTSNDFDVNKGIHYRANPANGYFLTQLQDVLQCPLVLALSNNHMLDFGRTGLLDTLQTLRNNNLRFTGAGKTLLEAQRPQEVAGYLIFSCSHPSAGVPLSWAATTKQSGVWLLSDLDRGLQDVLSVASENVGTSRKILMFHYGPNWVRRRDRAFQVFAQNLIRAGFYAVINTSPHHVPFDGKLEYYDGGVICYGLGDFLNDYYGIQGSSSVGALLEVSGDHPPALCKFCRIGFQLEAKKKILNHS